MAVAPTPVHRRAPNPSWVLIAALALLATATVVVLVVVLVRHDVVHTSSSSTAVRGSGVAASQTREVAPFTSVELAGSTNVTVSVGGPRSVTVHADDNLLRRVTTQVRDGRLVIGNTPGSFVAKSPMRVAIRTPSLGALGLSGSGGLVATGVRASSLTVTLGGSGVLRASGHVTRLDVSLGGSGDVQLQRLVAADVRVILGGSGRILVTATRRLDASVPGSGVIVYAGNPAVVSTNVTGSGSVTRASDLR